MTARGEGGACEVTNTGLACRNVSATPAATVSLCPPPLAAACTARNTCAGFAATATCANRSIKAIVAASYGGCRDSGTSSPAGVTATPAMNGSAAGAGAAAAAADAVAVAAARNPGGTSRSVVNTTVRPEPHSSVTAAATPPLLPGSPAGDAAYGATTTRNTRTPGTARQLSRQAAPTTSDSVAAAAALARAAAATAAGEAIPAAAAAAAATLGLSQHAAGSSMLSPSTTGTSTTNTGMRARTAERQRPAAVSSDSKI